MRVKTIAWAMMLLGLAGPLAAQQPEVYPLPEAAVPEADQSQQQRDEDEVSIPTLPGTAEVKPPVSENPAEAEGRDLRELPIPTPPRREASRQPAVDDAMLQRFIRAYRDVAAINARYARLMPTADEGERRTLAQDGNAEMRAAIERAGLSVSDYDAISLRRWQDAAFAQTLNTRLSANP